MRSPLAALTGLFLAAHLLYLPPTLEDIDSVNFALGVRDFDISRHQPHPPGYPVFIALARLSTGTLQALNVDRAATRGLALLSALSGALLIPVLFTLFRRLSGDLRLAWWATAVTACSPLFWFTALRPLSDMTGLAFAAGAQVLLIPLLLPRADEPHGSSDPGRRGPVAPDTANPRPARLRLTAGAALCGLAAGVRSQTVMLTAPLLLAALLWPGTGLTMRHRAGALLAVSVAALAWAVPLLAASGGLSNYLTVLGTQAGEDFSGVAMLWTAREPRVVLHALLSSFVWPWGSVELGLGVMLAAGAGCVRAAWRAPRIVVVLAAAFGPYAVFHLLFQETATTRYALPLVPPVAFLTVYAAAGLGRAGATITGAALVFITLSLAVPPTREYARHGSPAFGLFEGAIASSAPGVLGMHGVMRRVEEWNRDRHQARVLRARHGREWLALVEHWRQEPESAVSFLADPRRTDLALFDPHARSVQASARWTFPELPFVAGARPGAADLYRMAPPGWMLDRGWALTAEVGGVTAAERLGPHVEPAVAWARARDGRATLIVAGRNVAGDSGPSARLTLTGGTRPIDEWDARPGPFFRHVVLPAGTLAGTGYVPLRLGAARAAGSGAPPPVTLEQFDLQPDGAVMLGLLDGWQEPEYSPVSGRAWRWMSEAARLWIRPIGRDVTLTLSGESPLRYFDRAPVVRAAAGGIELTRFSPATDFSVEIVVPEKALAASGGLVALESSQWFTPADRASGADRRHLALRIYSVTVK